MFGFTISKINLLILVLSMFVILTYFMFGWSTVLVKYSAQQIIDKRIGSDIYNKIDSESICDRSPINSVPKYIDYFADIASGGRYFYTVKISKLVEEDSGKNYILLKAASRIDPNQIIGGADFETFANVRLFEWVEDETRSKCFFEESDSLLIDPQGDMWGEQIPKDAVTILMERYEGEKTIYIIACSSKGGVDGGFCEENLGLVGCMIKKERGFEGACFPIAPCCESDNVSEWTCGCDIGD